MTPFNIAFLFCRLLSLWCVARFVETFAKVSAAFLLTYVFPGSGSNLWTRNDQTGNISGALGMCFLACALWLGAPIIAQSVAQNIEYSNGVDQPKTTRNWWNIGRGLLGLYFLVTGLGGLCTSAFYLVAERYLGSKLSSPSFPALQLFYFAPAISAVLYIIGGAWLLLVARRALKREADSVSSQDAKETGSL